MTIYRESTRGDLLSRGGWQEIEVKDGDGYVALKLGFIEDEVNIGPLAADTMVYAPELTLSEISPAQAFGFRGTRQASRLANVGGVYAIRSFDRVLCVEFSQLPSVSLDGQELIRGRYRIFIELPRSIPEDSEDLLTAIDQALDALTQVGPSQTGDEEDGIGIGHNAPPLDSALTQEDYRSVEESLRTVRQAVVDEALTPELAERVSRALGEAAKAIVIWGRKRLGLIEEGFYRGVGAAAATGLVGIGLWMATGGKIERVSTLLLKFAGHMIGAP